MKRIALVAKERAVMQALAEGKECRSIYRGLGLSESGIYSLVKEVVAKVGAQSTPHALAILAAQGRIDRTNLEASIERAKTLELTPELTKIVNLAAQGNILSNISRQLHKTPQYARTQCRKIRHDLDVPTLECLIVVLVFAGHIQLSVPKAPRLQEDQRLLLQDILLGRTIAVSSEQRGISKSIIARDRAMLLHFLKAKDWYHAIAIAIRDYHLDPPRELWEAIRLLRTIEVAPRYLEYIRITADKGEERARQIVGYTSPIRTLLGEVSRSAHIHSVRSFGMFASLLWAKNLGSLLSDVYSIPAGLLLAGNYMCMGM